MSYQVLAPLVLVRVPREGDGDRIDYHYAGSIIPALTPEQEKQFLSEGLVLEIGAPDGEDGGDAGPTKPPHVATKDVWVAYVVAKTANTDKPVTAEEADAMNKSDLIELYG